MAFVVFPEWIYEVIWSSACPALLRCPRRNQVADWLDAGKLRGTLKDTLSPINATNLRKAHQRLESGTMIGKLVLKGW